MSTYSVLGPPFGDETAVRRTRRGRSLESLVTKLTQNDSLRQVSQASGGGGGNRRNGGIVGITTTRSVRISPQIDVAMSGAAVVVQVIRNDGGLRKPRRHQVAQCHPNHQKPLIIAK